MPVLMTPSPAAGRQVGSDAGDVNIFATSGDALPTINDKLADELVEIRGELRAQTESIRVSISASISAVISAQICEQNEKFDQKFKTMIQVFMESSNATTESVSAVKGRVKIIDKLTDANHRLVDSHIGQKRICKL